MNAPATPPVLKALVAPARHGDGPTLYLICEAEKKGYCVIYEQTPEGSCIIWPGEPIHGVQQAESIIYRWPRKSV
jgi:hypothetical protein